MNLEKIKDILNDVGFVKLWIMGSLDETMIAENLEFMEKIEPILSYMDNISKEEDIEFQKILSIATIQVYKNDINLFKKVAPQIDYVHEVYDIMGEFISEHEEIYLDEEFIYKLVENSPIIPEKVFNYYLEKNPIRFLSNFKIVTDKGKLVPSYLNNLEYIKKFIENDRPVIIKDINMDIPLELFSLALSKNLQFVNGDYFVNTKEKLLYALNEYQDIKALDSYFNYSRKYDISNIRIDLDIVKAAVENCNYTNFAVDEFILDYDSTAYLINKKTVNILDKYIFNHPKEYENIKQLISLVISNGLTINLDYEYILNHKEFLEMIIKGQTPGYLRYIEMYVKTGEFDVSILKLALENAGGIVMTSFDNALVHDKKYVKLMLDYGETKAFQMYYKYVANTFSSETEIAEMFDTELILKSGLCSGGYSVYSYISDKASEINESIFNSINNGEPLPDELKEINPDPIMLYLMAGHPVREEMLYNYDYVKTICLNDNRNFTQYLNEFIEHCENGLVEGRLFDEELFSIALNKGYFVNEDTPDAIVSNYDYMMKLIKKSVHRAKYYKGEIDLEMFKLLLNNFDATDITLTREMVEYAIKNGAPDLLDKYSEQGGVIDDELIRLAIKNGYCIKISSPKEILNNFYEYLKLNLLSIKKNDVLKEYKCKNLISTYRIYCQSHNLDNMMELDTELLDIAFSIKNKCLDFPNFPVISNYEMCEHYLKKGGKDIIDGYLLYISKNPDKENKLPDFNLYLLECFNLLYFQPKNTLLKYLTPKEIDTLKLFMTIRDLLKNVCVININNLNEYFTPNGITDKLYDEFRKNDYALFKTLNNRIVHDDDILIKGVPDNLFSLYRIYLEEYLHIDKDKIDNILSKMPNGKDIILYLGNDSIIKFIKSSNEDIDKIINMFNMPKFEFNEFKDKIYDSVKQEQFIHDYLLFKDIFVYFRGAINENDEKEITRLKYLVNTILPHISYEEIDNSVELAYKGDYNSLHDICNQFIKKAREVYRKENNNLLAECNFPYKYNRTELIKKLGTNYILEKISYTDTLGYIDIEEDMFNILKRILLKDPTVTKEEKQKYGKYANKLNKFLYMYTEKFIEGKENEYLPLVEKDLEKSYYIWDVNINILAQISKIDFVFLEKLINDEKLYNKFIELNKYYKIGSIPPHFISTISTALNKDVKCNFQDLSKYIMFFSSFMDLELKKQNAESKEFIDIDNVDIKFMSLLKYFISVNSEIKEISRILTKEDYQLIEKNPGPNSSGMDSEQRLKKAIDSVFMLYTNNSISIPTFDENISFNNKEINVVVGNRTSTCNLTHGERTGACMRIGGAGVTLFNFCLSNSNGFHIRFEDPNTHEYISRVSGFRNGNTVFLNQLRYSSNKELYSDLELVEYIKIVANKLVELTRDSECPIENVVISGDYAVSDSSIPPAKIDIENIKEGLPFFYTDVDKINSYLLVSPSNSTDIHVDTDKSKVPSYKPVRDKVYGLEVGIDKLQQLINSKYSIKVLLKKEDYTMIEDLVSDNLVDGYVGTDFYVYIDSDYNIHSDYFDMDNYHDKDASLEEMNMYKEILMNKYNIIEKRY